MIDYEEDIDWTAPVWYLDDSPSGIACAPLQDVLDEHADPDRHFAREGKDLMHIRGWSGHRELLESFETEEAAEHALNIERLHELINSEGDRPWLFWTYEQAQTAAHEIGDPSP